MATTSSAELGLVCADTNNALRVSVFGIEHYLSWKQSLGTNILQYIQSSVCIRHETGTSVRCTLSYHYTSFGSNEDCGEGMCMLCFAL
ncbi:MAG: hypothetical protein ACI8RD_002698 [Bacillariaceae sp.]|jgi:hypothetical protein